MTERERRIEANLGLVHACARRLKGRGMEYEDLYQAGCVGLVKATDGFDESRGLQFSTYAVPVILGEMRRLFREGGTLKVGRSLQELSRKANRAAEDFSAKEGRSPTLQELAALLGIEPAQAAQAVGAGRRPLSLTTDGENGGELDLPVESEAEKIGELLALRQAMTALAPNDRKLLYYRYFQRETQSKAGARLGMTQVQVSRREKALLSSLRQALQ